MYDNYLIQYNKKGINSLLTSLIEITSNKRYSLFITSALDKLLVPPLTANILLTNGYIRETGDNNSYAITGKGVYYVELKEGKNDMDRFIDFIDSKYFDILIKAETKINSKQKIAIFSMIAARTFSIDSPMDLKRDDNAKDIWEKITIDSYQFLQQLGVIEKIDENKLFGKAGNEAPVSNYYRHVGEQLPKLTEAIFKSNSNKQQYFLDVSSNGEIDADKLSFLFRKIFSGLTLESFQINEIYNFLKEISLSQERFIFDRKKHIFSHNKYDRILREVLINI
jgi:hypothetical protein